MSEPEPQRGAKDVSAARGQTKPLEHLWLHYLGSGGQGENIAMSNPRFWYWSVSRLRHNLSFNRIKISSQLLQVRV